MKHTVNAEAGLVAPPHSKGPIAYFFLTTFLFTGSVSLLIVPLYLVGQLWRPAFVAGRWILYMGAKVLMAVQPWHFERYRFTPLKSERPVLYVCNHQSHLDVFYFIRSLATLRVISKWELLYVPFLGPFMWLTQQILAKKGIDNYARAIETAKKGVLRGDEVLIFPETTRCPEGFVGVQKFQIAPFAMAREIEALIVPVCVHGTGKAWPKGKLGIQMGHRITLSSLEPLDSKEFNSAKALSEIVRSRIETELLELENDRS
ncbi:MAG: 1-acyl-sn-glycerol-3-phosphate acyltransferase [Bdellovibrionales bacterium]|nr:1-acyl-sn-glycerol-3-phosphate acyltransferase [Bdellovibrionales bacterium]